MWRLLITLAIALRLAMPAHVSVVRVAIEREAVAIAPAPLLPAGARLLGPVPGDRPLRLVVGLAPRRPDLLDDYAWARADGRGAAGALTPGALTPGAFGRLFGPSDADQAAVAAYLSSNGLRVVRAYPDHLLLDVVGTAARVSAAFGVPLARYQGRDGQPHYMNTAAPRLPAGLARLVNAVAGLRDDGAPYRPLLATRAGRAPLRGRARHAPRDSAPPAGLLIPAAIRAAYDLTPVYTRTIATGGGQTTTISNTGTGQTIALVEFAPYDPADIAAYDSAFGLAATAPTSVSVDGGATNAYGYVGRLEASLDIEVAQAVAPGARILVYSGPSSPTATDLTQADDIYARIVNDDQAQALSTNWGQCEAAQQADRPPDFMLMHTLLAQAVAEGMTVVAATGDQGAYDCNTPSGAIDYSAPAVDYPASDPLALAVGGTNLQLNPNGGGAAEPGWAASGGGLSAVFARPAWQTGPGVSNALSNGMRQVPDVAVDAGHDYAIRVNDGWSEAGGTSAGPPFWSGLLALTNEARYSRTRPQGAPAAPRSCAVVRGLGDIHGELYGLGGTTAYRDITDGPNNGLASPGPGWDYVTGWGVPDADALLRALVAAPALSIPTPDSCPSPTSTSTPTSIPASTSTSVPTSMPSPTGVSTAGPTDTALPAAAPSTPTATTAPSTPTATLPVVAPAATPTNMPAGTPTSSATAATVPTTTGTVTPKGTSAGAATGVPAASATKASGSTTPRPRRTPTARPGRSPDRSGGRHAAQRLPLLVVALSAWQARGEAQVRVLLRWVRYGRIALSLTIDGRDPRRAVLRANVHGAATYLFPVHLSRRGRRRRAIIVLQAYGLVAHGRTEGVARLALRG